MAEKNTIETNYSSILELLAEHIETTTGIKAIVEPQPAKVQEPHVRIMATGFSFESENDAAGYEVEKLYTVSLGALLTLNAYGDGPDKFLDYCLHASFKMNKLFERPFNIPIMTGMGMSVKGQRRPGGQFFRNEDKGEKPYLYEESFDVSIFFPYAETINQ